jgi:hypothetical protein
MVPRNYLNKILGEEKVLDNSAPKSRLKVTDEFRLPSNSSHASLGKPKDGNIGALSVPGTEQRRTKPIEKAVIIGSSMSILQEMIESYTVDQNCSIQADNMQEPRPAEDDCPEALNSTVMMMNDSNGNDIVPSSQPEDDEKINAECEELKNLLCTSKSGKLTIDNDEEKNRLFGSSRRVLRSNSSWMNKSLVPYEITPQPPMFPRQKKRSFEVQDDNDFIDDSPATRKSKRLSKGSTPKIPGKVPELPADYEQSLEARNFQTKGRKQCDEVFGELGIKGYDLYSLRTRQYLNDLVIDNYLKLVCKRSISNLHHRRSFAFDTFFYPLISSNQQEKAIGWIKENLFDYELLFLPINQENHWFLFVVDTVNRNYFIYDSLYYGDYTSEVTQIVEFLKEYSVRKNHEIDWTDWSNLPLLEQNGPTQSNGVDCGIFLCQYVEHLSRRAPLDFAQCGMVNYRKRMLYELMNGELLEK